MSAMKSARLLITGLGLLLAGCGSDEGSSDSTSSAKDASGDTARDASQSSDDDSETSDADAADADAADAAADDSKAEAGGSDDPSDASGGDEAGGASDSGGSAQDASDVADASDASRDGSSDSAEDAAAEAGDAEAGPPAEAYEACSGDPVPALQLTQVIGGLDRPIHAVTPRADASTMFVAERGGSVKRFDISQSDPEGVELLSFDASTTGECGLLSIALHPNYDGEGENRLYVSHNPTCTQDGGSSALDLYTVDGDTATFSETLYETDQPQSNHNGGLIAFGPDGYLYFGLGDGGSSNDRHGDTGNGQNPNTPLGSILRFDADDFETTPSGNLTSDDVDGQSVDSRIFHYGLRNPWRFSWDRATGDLYIGDVGQNAWEEVSYAPAGSRAINFGWAAREAYIECPGCDGKMLIPGTTAVDPIFAYANPGREGGGASVTGGFVYRGERIPGLYGRYIFGDYNHGAVSALTYDGDGDHCDYVEELIPNSNLPDSSVASFAEDADGELYVLNLARGVISRIEEQ
jgi:glucose/arabinose dehydrogenase